MSMQKTNSSKGVYSLRKLFYFFGDFYLYLYILLTFSMDILFYDEALLPIKTFFLIMGGIIGFINCLKTFNKKIIILILLFICSFIAVYLSGKPLMRFSVLIFTLLHIGLALNLISHKHSPKIPEIIYYFCINSMIIKIIIFSGNLGNYMFSGVSGNYISILALLFLGLYVVALEQNNLELPFLPVLLFFVLTIGAYGRGGIISGLLILFLTILNNIQILKNRSNKIIAYIAIILFLFLSISTLIMTPIGKNIFRKFVKRGSFIKDDRLVIWYLFFRDTFKSYKSIILGGKINTAAHEDGNLHNSFLLCYGYYGLIPFLTILFFYIFYIIRTLKQNNKTLLIFAIIFFVRANTDRVFYQGYNEFLLYYILFNSINANKTRFMRNKTIKFIKGK